MQPCTSFRKRDVGREKGMHHAGNTVANLSKKGKRGIIWRLCGSWVNPHSSGWLGGNEAVAWSSRLLPVMLSVPSNQSHKHLTRLTFSSGGRGPLPGVTAVPGVTPSTRRLFSLFAGVLTCTSYNCKSELKLPICLRLRTGCIFMYRLDLKPGLVLDRFQTQYYSSVVVYWRLC